MRSYIVSLIFVAAMSIPFVNAQTQVSQTQTNQIVTDTEDSVIKVQTDVTQIAVTTTFPYKNLRWELLENGTAVKEYNIDSPETSRLSFIILVLQTEPNTKIFRDKAGVINKRLKTLEKELNLAGPPAVIYYGGDSQLNYLKYPSGWNTHAASSASTAVEKSILSLQTNTRSSRRALLIISDAKESLPKDILMKTDLRLLKQSALVFYLGVAVERDDHNKSRVVALSNLPSGKLTIFGKDYIGSLFSFFTDLANNMYVLSFESDASHLKVDAFGYDERNVAVGSNMRVIQTTTALEALGRR